MKSLNKIRFRDIFDNITNIFLGDKSIAFLKKHKQTLIMIRRISNSYKELTEEEFINKTKYLKENKDKISRNKLMIESYALALVATSRVLNIELYDEQIYGSIALYEGRVIELQTGEGKTYLPILTGYLRSILGYQVHIVTANDYLAKRDYIITRKVFNLLGLTSDYVDEYRDLKEVIQAYKEDILYGSARDLAVNYLKKHLIQRKEYSVDYNSEKDKIEDRLLTVIIDEIDYLLTTEANVPVIITSPINKKDTISPVIDRIIKELKEKLHYIAERNKNQINFTELGLIYLEDNLRRLSIIDDSLYNENNIYIYLIAKNSLRANYLLRENVDYVLDGNNLYLVDQNGRISKDRQYGEGLHNSLLVKHGLHTLNETITVAKITYSIFFGGNYTGITTNKQLKRIYREPSGMTGTLKVSKSELVKTYGFTSAIFIPPHRKCIRKVHEPKIYRYKDEMLNALIEDLITERNKTDENGLPIRPIIIATTSIEESFILSNLLSVNHIPHMVLNALKHKEESEIINQAGKKGRVTVVTDMAGRGADPAIGGPSLNPNDKDYINQQKEKKEIEESGGVLLYIVGAPGSKTNKLQFEGRVGRQGAPGEVKVYYSFDDKILDFTKDPSNQEIIEFRFSKDKRYFQDDSYFSDVINLAQNQILARESEERKKQHETGSIIYYDYQIHVYELRNRLLDSDIKLILSDIFKEYNNSVELSNKNIKNLIGITVNSKEEYFNTFKEKLSKSDEGYLRVNSVSILDSIWQEFLSNTEERLKSMFIVGYAQLDPVQEFKMDSFKDFIGELINKMRLDLIRLVYLTDINDYME